MSLQRATFLLYPLPWCTHLLENLKSSLIERREIRNFHQMKSRWRLFEKRGIFFPCVFHLFTFDKWQKKSAEALVPYEVKFLGGEINLNSDARTSGISKRTTSINVQHFHIKQGVCHFCNPYI